MLLRRGGKIRHEIDMTEGPILPKIVAFTGPLIVTGILQLLYNAADVIVVGNYAGHEALAAVSSTGSLINLLVNVFMGLSVGASVVIARYYGAHDIISLRKAEHTAMTLALFMGIGVGLFGFLAARPLLQMMDSPEDVIDGAALYVRIYFLGMPANMLYNFGAGVLRAVGDTKRPMYYLMIAGMVNVLLNLLLVIVFHLDVAGVAIATVASQVISAALVLMCLLRSRSVIHLNLQECRIDRKSTRDIIRIGLGMGLLIRLIGPQLMSLYNPEQDVIANGLIRMDIIMPTYFLCGLMDVMVGELRGIGYSVMPMVVSLTGACLLRIVWILTVFAQDHTLTILYLSYPVSWFVTFAIHYACYHIAGRKRLRQLEEQKA